MKSKHAIFLLLALIFFMSCSDKDKIQNRKESQVIPSISKDSALSIFIEKYRIKPLFLDVFHYTEDEIIGIYNQGEVNKVFPNFYSSPNFNICSFSKFANSWQVVKTKTILNDEYTYMELLEPFNLIERNNNKYIFFIYSTTPMGNATDYTQLFFTLIDIKDLQIKNIVYGGDPFYDKNGKLICVKGDFIDLAAIKNDKEVYSILEELISKSNYIYRPTKDDLDINNAKNYEKKWTYDNPNAKNCIEKIIPSYFHNEKLNLTYYKEDLFKDFDKGSIAYKIENNNYIIVSCFRYHVLGYDKIKKKYFPIWLDGCNHGCNKRIQFINEHTLEIIYEESNNQKVIINFKKGEFSTNL